MSNAIQVTINTNEKPNTRTEDQTAYAYGAITQAICQNKPDEVVRLLLEFFIDDIEVGFAFAFEMTCKSYPDIFDRLCFEAISKGELLTKVFTNLTQRKQTFCLEACIKHIPNIKDKIQLSMQPFCVEARKIPYESLILLYERECISWEENNVLYKHLNHNILNQASYKLTDNMKTLCKASYKLWSSTMQLRRTFANDFVQKIATEQN